MFKTLLAALLAAGCAPDPSSTSGLNLVEDVTWSGYRLRQAALTSPKCDSSIESPSGKISSSLTTAFAQDPIVEVLVSMKTSVLNGPLPDPMPGTRSDPTRDQAWMNVVLASAESQRCAVAAAVSQGSTYEESFVLGNSFTATMSSSAADALAARADVGHLEPTKTSTPPP